MPADPRLPDGGGYVIGDLWNISRTSSGRARTWSSPRRRFGEQIQYWHGVDVNVNVRMRNGLTLQGGTSTGREVDRRVRGRSSTIRAGANCRVTEPFRTQVKGLGTYTIPKVDVQVSGTFQSRPGG